MSWNITISDTGGEDSATVEGANLGEAVKKGLEELGRDSQDEGSVTITVNGEGDSAAYAGSGPSKGSGRQKKPARLRNDLR